MHTDTRCELMPGFMDPASTAGLSLRDEETWLPPIRTVLDNNVSFPLNFSSSFLNIIIIFLGFVLTWKKFSELYFLKKHLNYYKEVVDESNLQNRNNMLLGSKCVNNYLEWERNNLV